MSAGWIVFCVLSGIVVVVALTVGILIFKEKFYKDAPYDKN